MLQGQFPFFVKKMLRLEEYDQFADLYPHMFRTRVTMVLPVFNEEAAVGSILGDPASFVAKDFPWRKEVYLVPMVIDDGSTDATHETVQGALQKQYWEHRAINDAVIIRNEKNSGLTRTLQRGFRTALEYGTRHVLKTDLDADFNLGEVVTRIVPEALRDPLLVVGARERPFAENRIGGYEHQRYQDISRILDQESMQLPFHPSACGTYMMRWDILMKVMQTKEYQAYDHPWGLDFLVVMLATKISDPNIVRFSESHYALPLVQGSFDENRRPIEKIRAQYDAYVEIVATMRGKEPQALSPFYNKGEPQKKSMD